MAASRLLIQEALRDSFAQRFQLLCETSIPVRNQLYTWTQLLAENRSRIGDYYDVSIPAVLFAAIMGSVAPLQGLRLRPCLWVIV